MPNEFHPASQKIFLYVLQNWFLAIPTQTNEIQSNLFNTDTNETEPIVRFIEVSVLYR